MKAIRFACSCAVLCSISVLPVHAQNLQAYYAFEGNYDDGSGNNTLATAAENPGELNFVAGFRGKRFGVRSDGQEVDVTFDYKIQEGLLQSFWLRVRGSWLREDAFDRDGTDVRVILRYDFPVI